MTSNASCLPSRDVDDSFDQQIATELDALDELNTEGDGKDEPTATTSQPSPRFSRTNFKTESEPEHHSSDHFLNRRLKRKDDDFFQMNGTSKPKPNLHLKQKIAQLNQTAALYAKEGTEEDLFGNRTSGGSTSEPKTKSQEETMRRHDDHVSCEDLLEFSAKSQSKSRGQDSDEVRLMSKVLGKETSSENCLKALNATDWDVYSAIKLAKLQNILKNSGIFPTISSCLDALVACDGDVAKAASVLITQGSPPDFV